MHLTLTGPDWPRGGEIDILEGVNDYERNQATLHTSAGCEVAARTSDALSITGSLIAGTTCDVDATSNQGCGMRADTATSYGAGFNRIGGGVYASTFFISCIRMNNLIILGVR